MMRELNELILRGMKPYFSVSDEEIIREVARAIVEDRVFVAYDGVKPKAFCILYMPKSPLDVPQVLHFYSEGSRALTRSLVSKVLDFVKKKGYTKLTAINGSGMNDETWKRAFQHEGWKINPVRTVFDFEVIK